MEPEARNLELAIRQAAKEKGVDRSVLVAALEDAVLKAAKKQFGENRRMEARYNPEKGVVELFQIVTVVDRVERPEEAVNQIPLEEARRRGMDVEPGDELVFPIYYLEEDAEAAKAQDEQYGDLLKLKTFRRGFGRIAAQTVLQVIQQHTMKAERARIYEQFKNRKGELISGVARRYERGNLIVDLGAAEAVLPAQERLPGETFRPGDRLTAYVLDVLEESRGPQVILSRASPQFVAKLLEREVPELAQGIVAIEAIAREPGARTKVAVSSRDPDVDPVGACVGPRGARVQAVTSELRDERIDIVAWDPDPVTFVCNALRPAEVTRVVLDEANRTMELVVPDDQLSLAIGRKGQNVRLAAQLTGWKLDINTESRVREMRERARRSLFQLPGMNEALFETLYAHGLRSAKDIARARPELLSRIPGISPEQVPAMQQAAQKAAEREEEALPSLEQRPQEPAHA